MPPLALAGQEYYSIISLLALSISFFDIFWLFYPLPRGQLSYYITYLPTCQHFFCTFFKFFSVCCFLSHRTSKIGIFCAYLQTKPSGIICQRVSNYSFIRSNTFLAALSSQSPSKSSIIPASQAEASFGLIGIFARTSVSVSFAVSSI